MQFNTIRTCSHENYTESQANKEHVQSSFYQIKQKTWFSSWMKLKYSKREEFANTFESFSSHPSKEMMDEALTILKGFVAYSYSSEMNHFLDDYRFHLLQRMPGNDLPPSTDSLFLTQISPQSPELWGWMFSIKITGIFFLVKM